MTTLIPLALGIIFGLLIACIVAVLICDKPDMVKKPQLDAELTNTQAIQKLQEIKPYYAYKGRTWTAIDMAIKALGGEEEDETCNTETDGSR